MGKVEIDEGIFNNLILKALPKEYEVLLQDDALTDEEIEYLHAILLIIDGRVGEIKDWITSEEFEKLTEDVKDLPLGFFDDFKIRMRVYLQNKFELLILPLLTDFYIQTNKNVYSSFNLEPELTDNDLSTFIGVKQYNYELLSNLCDDLDKNFKDIILDGVVNDKSVNEIANDLEVAGINPLNRHTAQQRAEMIARTEVNNIKNKARLQAFKDNNVKLIDIITMGDGKVCQDCLNLEANNPYLIEDANKLLPVHPRCRCIYARHIENNNSYDELDYLF